MKKLLLFIQTLPVFYNVCQAQTFDTLQTFILPNQYAIGIVFDASTNEYIVSTAGAYGTLGDQAFLRFDLSGAQVDSVSQNNSDILGYKDITTDGTYIYASYAQEIHKIDKSTFMPVDTIPAPNATCRGLAMEADGTFWESNANSAEPLTHFDTLGAVISTCPSSSYSTEAPYGMALDSISYPGTKWMWMATHTSTTAPTYGVHLTKYNINTCTIDTVINLTAKAPEYTGTLTSAGSAAGLHVMENHPNYPGKIIALYVGRKNGGNSYVMLVDITPLTTGITVAGYDVGTTVKPYPNPFSFSTTLRLNQEEVHGKDYKVIVYNTLGEEVKRISYVNSPEITIYRDNMPAGMYFYSIQRKEQVFENGKLLVE